MLCTKAGLGHTPKTVNQYLSNNAGYDTNGSFYWAVAAKIDGPGGIQYVKGSTVSVAELKNIIDTGGVAIVKSRRYATSHWVLVFRYDGAGGTLSDFRYLDPMDSSRVDRPCNDGWVVNGAVLRHIQLPGGSTSSIITIDNSDLGGNIDAFGYFDWCRQYPFTLKGGYGINGSMKATRNNDGHGLDAVAQWKFSVPVSSTYRIEAYIPSQYGTTKSARYEMWRSGTMFANVVTNQLVRSNEWVTLYTTYLPAGTDFRVRLLDLTGEPYNSVWIAADAMRIVRL